MDRQGHQLGDRRRRYLADAARRERADRPIARPYRRARQELRIKTMTFKVALVGMDGKSVPDWVYAELKQAKIDFVFKQCKSRKDLAETGGDADVIWVFGDHESVYKENLDVLAQCG